MKSNFVLDIENALELIEVMLNMSRMEVRVYMEAFTSKGVAKDIHYRGVFRVIDHEDLFVLFSVSGLPPVTMRMESVKSVRLSADFLCVETMQACIYFALEEREKGKKVMDNAIERCGPPF